MGRIDPGTARETAITPLEELDTAVTTLAVGAEGVWVGGALHLSPVPRVVVDRIDPPSGRRGVFTLARATCGREPGLLSPRSERATIAGQPSGRVPTRQACPCATKEWPWWANFSATPPREWP